MHRPRSKGSHVDLGLTGINTICNGNGGNGGNGDLLSWITQPASPLHGEDRFTRRPSLEVDDGELALRSRPSTGDTASSYDYDASPKAALAPAGSPTGVSLVLSPKRRAAVKPFPPSASNQEQLDEALLRPALRGTSHTYVRPGGEGVSHKYVRPLSSARGGRDSMTPPARPASAGQRPASAGPRPSTANGRSSRMSGIASSVGTHYRLRREEVFGNEEGEASPELEISLPYRHSRSSGSPEPFLESPDDFLCTRTEPREARLRLENEELAAVLTEGRRLARPTGSAHTERRSSVSPHKLNPRSSEHGDSDEDSSPLALGSAPVYRPQPPTSAKGQESPVRTLVGLRLPPVPNASLLHTSPPLKDTLLDRAELFKKTLKTVKPKVKPNKVLKKKPEETQQRTTSPRPASRGGESPLGSPVGAASGRLMSPVVRSTASVQKKLSAAAGIQSLVCSGMQRLSSPLIKTSDSPLRQRGPPRATGGSSPVPGLRRNVSSNGFGGGVLPYALSAIPRGFGGGPGRGMFDPSRPCIYVCQREKRNAVLSKVKDLRGIYRSIMQAVNQAVDGDTIQILSGTYEENVVLETSVCLKPVPGEEVTIRGDKLPAINSSAMSAKVENITIEHSGGDSTLRGHEGVRCIEVHAGDFQLINCTVSSSVGSGIMLLDQCYVNVQKSRVNDSGRCGIISFNESRVNCEDSIIKTGSTGTLTRCQVERNGQTGVLVSDVDTHATVLDCSVSANSKRGITAQHLGAFTLRGCSIKENHDWGVLLLGDASPCCCLLVSCNITNNGEGAVTIHGSVPDTSTCHIEGNLLLINTPLARPSPTLPARQFSGANTIQCAWRCHAAREGIRRQVQVFLKSLADEAAAGEKRRNEEEQERRNSPIRESSPLGSPDGREDMQVRLEGMAELEADVLDTFNRFDKLGNHMDQLLAEASMMP